MSGLLRICTAGSVDDGKSTLIGRLLYDSRARLRGPGALGREGVEEPHRRADRFLAVHRRPARRARAGHHDRRRLPLLRHRAAQVHPRRHARATSSTRATWRPAPRRPTSPSCWSTRATASATQSRRHALHRAAARHHRLRRSPSTRWTWSTSTAASSTTSCDDFDGDAARARDVHADSDQRAARRQRHHAERAHAVVRRAEPARVPRDRRSRARRAPRSRSGFRCSSCSGPTRSSAATPDRSLSGTVRVGDTRDGLAVRPHEPVKRIVTWDGDLDDGARADVGDADARGRDRHQPRRHARRSATIDVGQPVRGRRRVDGRAAARSRRALPAEAHARARSTAEVDRGLVLNQIGIGHGHDGAADHLRPLRRQPRRPAASS